MTAGVGGPGQAGWYGDPAGRFESRYWDGARWTQAVMDNGVASSDPEFHEQSSAMGPGGVSSNPLSAVPPPLGQAPPPGPVPRHGAVGSGTRERATSLSPRDAQERVCQVLAMSGYAPTQVAQGQVTTTVTIKPEPNGILLVVLIIFCLLPGIIYWYVASRPVHHQVTIFLTPNGAGTQILVQGHPDALAMIGPIVDRLPW